MSTTQDSTSTERELKQDIDEDLSQLVHQYSSRGLSPEEIADSMLWHTELAISRSEDKQTVEEYVQST